ncbi:MAG: hypothetical protein E6Q88_12475 [Lysobacteraceae bacterium]|nr:MAG: hypothetical protein E6Q88_12475 [Xanthomonadaceae bacterium]
MGTTFVRLTAVPLIVSGARKCLDVHVPDQHNNGARVQVWDCNNALQQTWKIEGDTIRSGAGKYLDAHAPDQYSNGALRQTSITP